MNEGMDQKCCVNLLFAQEYVSYLAKSPTSDVNFVSVMAWHWELLEDEPKWARSACWFCKADTFEKPFPKDFM